MTADDFFKNIYKLSFITRYSNCYRIRDEDVAQHSFFVSAIVLKLYEEYSFNLEAALVCAISHDIMEADISDVTHDIKMRHPGLRRELLLAELCEVQKYPLLVKKGYTEFEKMETTESLVANLADVLQVRQYVESERMLGNTTMEEIYLSCRSRISTLLERLKNERRNKNTS